MPDQPDIRGGGKERGRGEDAELASEVTMSLGSSVRRHQAVTRSLQLQISVHYYRDDGPMSHD